jgi:hypothetical protein
MKRPSRTLWPGVATAAAPAGFILALAIVLSAGSGLQSEGLIGYISKDRIVELAAAADPTVASFTPSAIAQASFIALVDPVHVRMFLVASRPADVKLAADVGRAVEAAANPALTAEFVGVAADLSEPKALISENAVTAVPEIVVYWLGSEVGRMHPEAGATVDADLADFITQARTRIAEEMIQDNDFFKYTFHKDLLLDCKRCHGPSGSGLAGATIKRAAERLGAAFLRSI